MTASTTITIHPESLNKTLEHDLYNSIKNFSQSVRTSPTANSLHPAIYDCFTTLEKLQALPEQHHLYLQSDVALIASQLIAYVSGSYNVDTPLILPENDECVALTWESGSMKQILAIYADAVDLTMYSKALDVACHQYLCDDGNFDFDRVGKAVSKSGTVNNITAT